MKREDFEIMAPVGSFESLAAALRAGADSIYFGIENLNMRAHSACAFTVDDLHRIAAECRRCGVKSYLTVNTIIYGEDLPLMRRILDAALEADISAVIASDVAVMTYCRQIGLEVHLSTQLNISNIEALRFYAQFADVVVLARELNISQVTEIYRGIQDEHICGPSGQLVRIEMFCHGALCMAISGKCYLSLQNTNHSANRGECLQLCRRAYTVRDRETGTELDIDNKYVMSPKDTVVRCYDEAIRSVLDGTFSEERKDAWDHRLSRVFNRGFWDGYYQGQTLGEWNDRPGSRATERKVYVGRGVRYYGKLQVAEFKIEAATLSVGDRILVTGPTTGALETEVSEIRFDLKPVTTAKQGQRVSIPIDRKVRASDKLFKLVPADEAE